jgi:N-acetylglucosaminyl-diphospho-decaprenol L-rhamnosyltransferase
VCCGERGLSKVPYAASIESKGWSLKFSIVVPVYNKAEYTKKCIDHLLRDREADWEIIVLNNASSDDTQEMLDAYGDQIRAVHNDENLGCAGAWNQGIELSCGDWIVVLNNDVLLPEGWLKKLEATANKERLEIVSPAIREGSDVYDLDDYAESFTEKLKSVLRLGRPNGICFMVKREVFSKVGVFDLNFKVGQYEDADFFRRCHNAKVQMATTGSALIHHYGSLTQKAMKKGDGLPEYARLNRAYYRKKWKLNPIKLQWERFWERKQLKAWRSSEMKNYGHMLFERFESPDSGAST